MKVFGFEVVESEAIDPRGLELYLLPAKLDLEWVVGPDGVRRLRVLNDPRTIVRLTGLAGTVPRETISTKG